MRHDEKKMQVVMVNSEKSERDCRRWRAIFDRDVSEEQCGRYYSSGGCVEGARDQNESAGTRNVK